MNRRNYVKSLLALTGLGIGSFSIFKWLEPLQPERLITIQDWEERRSLIAELAEVIIPTTDTPGAKDAKVDSFIIAVMSNCFDQSQQRSFISGLDDVEDYTLNRFGKLFLECDASSRQDTVEHFSHNLIESSTLLLKIKNRFVGKSFFSSLRELTVQGYCTSILGVTKALSYDPVPGTYNPCMFLSSHQTSWATK